ncbi:MAG: nucleoside deaminase [Desulfamplus sp.]|nr:nucleoside deaminase [Desulfamplus sp.]
MDDEYYMNLALEQAGKAAIEDEVPVGAVIADKSGMVVGIAHNQTITLCDPTGHAEILAIRRASSAVGNYRLSGMTIYVTIEPCIMCMGAIIHARMARLVYGSPDIRWGGAGSLYDFSSDPRLNHSLEIVSGVCRSEARELIQSFFRNKRSK